MTRKKGLGKIDTTTAIMLAGGAALLVYFVTRPRVTPITNPAAAQFISTPTGSYYLPGNTTAQTIQASGQTATSLINALNNAGIFG
jgi:hypothetical protein